MKKIFIFLFIGFIGFHLAVVGSTTQIQNLVQEKQLKKIIAYAKEYRKDTTLSQENEKLRQSNILKEIFVCLQKYDSCETLEKAIHAFLADEFASNEFTVIDAKTTEIGGKSQDTVYLVRDASDDLCCIVKAFKNPRDLLSKFVPEISALELIEQLNMPGVVPIKPIALASYSNKDGEWGLLMETAAKGQRVDQFVYQLGNCEPRSKERKELLKVCQYIFQRIAESLAELHEIKSAKPFPIPQEEIEKFVNKVLVIQENPFVMEQIEKHCSVDDFFQYLEEIKTMALKVEFFYSYMHGDFHLGNMLYDPSENDFYFIDVAKLHHSISKNGEPLQNGAKDLMTVEGNLIRKTLGVLNENEVELLLQSLYETYEKCSGQSINQDLLLFERVYKHLSRLVSYAGYVDEQDPSKRSEDQAIFENALEYFELQVQREKVCNFS